MDDQERGQVTRTAAQVYEEFFLPALFQQWSGRVADAAKIESGQRVLDVACGTGVLAREISKRVRETGTVVGLDVNEGMLAVAKRQAPHIEWKHGRAEALPFDDASFDAVVSQFGLMFFENRRAALQEMWRVLRPGGSLAVAVWDTLENSTGYAVMTNLLYELFGERAANAMRAPFVLGDMEELRALFADAGISPVQISTHDGTARYPSLDEMIHTEIRGWTLADMLDEAQYAQLLHAARNAMKPYIAPDGSIAFSAPAHIVSATRS